MRFERLLPISGLLLNALVWGCSWWPLRVLQSHGLHPLWTTVIVFAVAVTGIVVLRPHAVVELWRTPTLWVLAAAAGCTNAAFNWAVTIGDVVRVVLLFYLMPLWAVLLARALLAEPITARSLLTIALALAGAAVVLWPPEGGALPLPRSLADVLGIIGGFSFALNNVMLRREAARSDAARALAMFGGGFGVSAGIALALGAAHGVSVPPAPGAWIAGVLMLSTLFVMSNLALQYGAIRLPAYVTSVVMLSEVVFASVSAIAWGDAQATARVVIGGAAIVSAALLAARRA